MAVTLEACCPANRINFVLVLRDRDRDVVLSAFVAAEYRVTLTCSVVVSGTPNDHDLVFRGNSIHFVQVCTGNRYKIITKTC